MRHQQKIHRSAKKSCFILKREETAGRLRIPLPLFTLSGNSTIMGGGYASDRQRPGTDTR